MSDVIAVRVPKKLKNELQELDLDYAEEVRMCLERLVKRKKLKKAIIIGTLIPFLAYIIFSFDSSSLYETNILVCLLDSIDSANDFAANRKEKPNCLHFSIQRN